MKNILYIILLGLYFFIFLIAESSNLYLSWDRIIPQFLSLSILNIISFSYLFRNNLLIPSIASSMKEKIILSYSAFILMSLLSIIVATNLSEAIIVFSQYFTYLTSFIAIYSIAKVIEKDFFKYFIIFSIIAVFIESFSDRKSVV